MGSFLNNVLGTGNNYQTTPNQAGNPYSQGVLQNEVNNQANIYGQQQALGQQLQQQIAGQGPNPAQTQYQQNVQQNIANAQGLLSSQRGLNPALAAKLGSNVAAQSGQQAAAQSALQQQQQQLATTQNYGNLLGQEQQGNLAQQQLYVNPNTAAMQTNAGIAVANQQAGNQLVGGLLGALGSAGAAAAGGGKAHGGMIGGYADGGFVDSDPTSAPQSSAGKYLKGIGSSFGSLGNGSQASQPGLNAGVSSLGKGAGLGIANLLKSKTNQLIAGGPTDNMGQSDGMNGVGAQLAAKVGKIKNFKPGGWVPGKASVSGDSAKNDTVPAMVSPGEIVIPRSVVNSKDAAKKAADFVAAVLAKKKGEA